MADLTPNRGMQGAAQRGLRLYEDGKGGDGLVPATIADARKMAERQALSEDKVRRMPAWFARHEADKRPGWDSPGEETPGFVAWLLWGGDAGRRWAESKVRQLDQEANAMGRDKADAAIERREIISMGDRLLADALIDGVQEYGRYDAQSARYEPAAEHEAAAAEGRACANCIFYRGDEYAGPEGCVIVAANVDPQGGCRIGIYGQLPGMSEDEVADPAAPVDPNAPALSNAEGEVEAEQSLEDALEDVDEALQLGGKDEDDEEESETEAPEQMPTINIEIDIDNGENHNAEGGSKAVAGDMEVSEETETELVYPYRSLERHVAADAKAEWRESGISANYRNLVGYAAVFNAPSEDLGGFREVIARGAFERALTNPGLDVSLLWNHDPDTVMARTTNGTLELREDKHGLKMWARVDMDDFDARRMIGKIRAGLVNQMSFAFMVAEDGEEWTTRGDYPLRTIRQVESLHDVSGVTWPAYNNVGTKIEVLDRAIRSGRVPETVRASVAQAHPAGTPSSLPTEGEALRQLKAKAKSRLTIVKFDLTR